MIPFKKTILQTLFVILLLINNNCFANYKPAELFISNIAQKVLSIINSSTSSDKKVQSLEVVFYDVLDVDWMAKFAIAKFWKSMTDTQKSNYLIAYKKYLIKTYAPRFKEYINTSIEIVGSTDIGNAQYQVLTKITRSKRDQDVINVSYRCKENNNQFKIRDITSENFSLIATQRSEFANIIAKGATSADNQQDKLQKGIDHLIETLSKK